MSLIRRPDLTVRWTIAAIVTLIVLSLLGEVVARAIGTPPSEPAVTREPLASQVLLCPEPGAGGEQRLQALQRQRPAQGIHRQAPHGAPGGLHRRLEQEIHRIEHNRLVAGLQQHGRR